MKIRFIGGDRHGQVHNVDGTRYVQAMAWKGTSAYWKMKDPGQYGPTIEQYERRRVYLSSLVGVEVMVIEGMQENEALRALANIIDGV